MDVLERRHDPDVSVKVSQIDRPSSGLQDLIRTLTGKDYGYSLRIDGKKNDLPAASPDMHDRSARGGMYIHHRLIFLFFSLLAATVSVSPSSFYARRYSCVLVFDPADLLHILACFFISSHGIAYLAAAPMLDGQGTGKLIFLPHSCSHFPDRISKA